MPCLLSCRKFVDKLAALHDLYVTHVANYHISSNKRLGAYLKFCLEGGGGRRRAL